LHPAEIHVASVNRGEAITFRAELQRQRWHDHRYYGAVALRTVPLFLLMGIQPGLAWATKIVTDPLHDILIYHRAPWHILRGDIYDDMTAWYRDMPARDR
jgi:hypothetical protein